MTMPCDMAEALAEAVRWTRERETEREIIDEVDDSDLWEWRPELLRWVRCGP
jgi:hypothetical protein